MYPPRFRNTQVPIHVAELQVGIERVLVTVTATAEAAIIRTEGNLHIFIYSCFATVFIHSISYPFA